MWNYKGRTIFEDNTKRHTHKHTVDVVGHGLTSRIKHFPPNRQKNTTKAEHIFPLKQFPHLHRLLKFLIPVPLSMVFPLQGAQITNRHAYTSAVAMAKYWALQADGGYYHRVMSLCEIDDVWSSNAAMVLCCPIMKLSWYTMVAVSFLLLKWTLKYTYIYINK